MDINEEEVVTLAYQVVADRDELKGLLARVADSVLDQTSGGLTVAYLPADLLAEIRRRAN